MGVSAVSLWGGGGHFWDPTHPFLQNKGFIENEGVWGGGVYLGKPPRIGDPPLNWVPPGLGPLPQGNWNPPRIETPPLHHSQPPQINPPQITESTQ